MPESTEDHLERIQELVEQKGYARVADIAASLNLSRSAVSNMVRRLAKRGFVNYEKYRGFSLTAEGRAVADHIRVRHQTLSELFQLLGLSPAAVEEEVRSRGTSSAARRRCRNLLPAFWFASGMSIQNNFGHSCATAKAAETTATVVFATESPQQGRQPAPSYAGKSPPARWSRRWASTSVFPPANRSMPDWPPNRRVPR